MTGRRTLSLGAYRFVLAVSVVTSWTSSSADAFSRSTSSGSRWNHLQNEVARRRRSRSILHLSSITKDDVVVEVTESETPPLVKQGKVAETTEPPSKSLWATVSEFLGHVEDGRLIFPELFKSRDTPRMFSSLEYSRSEEGKVVAKHASGSVLGSAALVAGTTIGAGIIALPTATAASGFVPSSLATIGAWAYMCMSGLLIAELTLNHMGDTGRPGTGILGLFESSLGKSWSLVSSGAFFFLQYAMMVAYIAQGGINVSDILNSFGLETLSSFPGGGQGAFAAVCGIALYAAKPSLVENVNNFLVLGVIVAFFGIMGLGVGTADYGALIDPVNQHPENVVSCFPILLLAFVYQGIVPTVVSQLEGDKKKIMQSIVIGTTVPLLMFLAWNAVVLGNVVGADNLAGSDPLALLQEGTAGVSSLLAPLVTVFSTLAVTTSVIGLAYGLVDALTDVFGINTKSQEYEKWRAPLFAGAFLPPLALSVVNPDVFYNALEFGGAFGISTLYLVLPPIMIWRERYEQDKPLITKPMVPLGKLSLGSMWKVAAGLIVEQGAEKFGLFEYWQDHVVPLINHAQ